MKPATSNLARSCDLPRPIIKSHQKKSGCGPGLYKGKLSKSWDSPLICLQRLKLTTSNFVNSWGLPRNIKKSHAEEKGAWPWTRELPKIWKFPFNIYTMAEASNFKIGTRLRLAKAHHKIPHRRDNRHAPGL